MEKKTAGFTLIELIVAVSIIGILAAISFPYFQGWLENARYKEAARNIASTLRDARARAIAQNVEHRVEFAVVGRTYQMARGTRAFGSTNWTNVVLGPIDLAPKGITLQGNEDCDSDTDVILSFNPNGTSGTGYVCIMDDSSPPIRKYRVGIPFAATGRIVISK